MQNDEVIQTMKEDPASNIFISARMREIAADSLASEREDTIEKLI